MAADITIQDLESVFGRPLIDQLADANKSLAKIQNLLGSKKMDAFDAMADKLEAVSDFIANLKRPKVQKEAIKTEDKASPAKRETAKDDKTQDKKPGGSIFDIEAVTASKAIGASSKILPVKVVDDPKKRTAVDVYIPPVTRVWIENLIGDTIKNVFDIAEEKDRSKRKETKKEDKKEDKKNWLEKLLAGLLGGELIAKLLGKVLSPLKMLSKLILGPFKWLAKELLLKVLPRLFGEIGKLVVPVVRGVLGSLGPLLLGVGGVVAGALTLLSGLKDSGPYKGTKKLFGRGLFEGGLAIIKKEFGKIAKVAEEAVGSLTKGGFLRNFIAATKKGFKNIFRTIGKLPEKIFGGAMKAIKSLFSGSVVKEVGEIAAKGAGKNMFKTFLSTAAKFLKKVPIIGSLVNIGFAVSRFMKGDVIGGALEVIGGIANLFPEFGGTYISYAIDGINAILDYKAGGATSKQTGAKIDLIGEAFKWLNKKVKYLPIIGPLTDMGIAITNGKWLDALGYLAKAAIPPLGVIVDLFDNAQTIVDTTASAVNTVGDFIGGVGNWIYKKVQDMPVIGSLLKAGEAIADGRWGDVLGYLGESIKPLQYIGDLIKSGATSIATSVATADYGAFFSSLKDGLFKAVLHLIPDLKIGGWSLRGKVAELLGIKGYSTATDNTVPSTPVVPKNHTKIAEANQSQDTQSKAIQPTDNKQAPMAIIQPTDIPAIPEDNNAQPDNATDSINDMSDSLNEHSSLLKGLIEYQKQTAANTKALIAAFKSQATAQNSIVSSSNTMNIITGPGTSSSFRADALARY